MMDKEMLLDKNKKMIIIFQSYWLFLKFKIIINFYYRNENQFIFSLTRDF